MAKVVFLDRDGVINEKAAPHEYVTRWEQFRFLPQAAEAIARLHAAGYATVIVSNQRCVARGLASEEEIRQLHERMCRALAEQGAYIDAVYVCPHEEGSCHCRKPEIGLFLQAEERFSVDKAESWMIGDSASDMEAGQRYGVHTVLVNNTKDICGDRQCRDLSAAADLILNGR